MFIRRPVRWTSIPRCLMVLVERTPSMLTRPADQVTTSQKDRTISLPGGFYFITCLPFFISLSIFDWERNQVFTSSMCAPWHLSTSCIVSRQDTPNSWEHKNRQTLLWRFPLESQEEISEITLRSLTVYLLPLHPAQDFYYLLNTTCSWAECIRLGRRQVLKRRNNNKY